MGAWRIAIIGWFLFSLLVLGGCGAVRDELETSMTVVGPIAGLPTRIAILRSKIENPVVRHEAMIESAYGRLELQTGEMLRRSKNIIVERRDLRSIREEQWWQYQPEASEDASSSLGQLLGAELLFVYKITAPSFRERLFNRQGGLKITVAAKILRVETGEVVWSHISAIRIHPQRFDFTDEYRLGLQGALDRVVDDMLTAVHDAAAMSDPQK